LLLAQVFSAIQDQYRHDALLRVFSHSGITLFRLFSFFPKSFQFRETKPTPFRSRIVVAERNRDPVAARPVPVQRHRHPLPLHLRRRLAHFLRKTVAGNQGLTA
jgi:hypothetical protein